MRKETDLINYQLSKKKFQRRHDKGNRWCRADERRRVKGLVSYRHYPVNFNRLQFHACLTNPKKPHPLAVKSNGCTAGSGYRSRGWLISINRGFWANGPCPSPAPVLRRFTVVWFQRVCSVSTSEPYIHSSTFITRFRFVHRSLLFFALLVFAVSIQRPKWLLSCTK